MSKGLITATLVLAALSLTIPAAQARPWNGWNTGYGGNGTFIDRLVGNNGYGYGYGFNNGFNGYPGNSWYGHHHKCMNNGGFGGFGGGYGRHHRRGW